MSCKRSKYSNKSPFDRPGGIPVTAGLYDAKSVLLYFKHEDTESKIKACGVHEKEGNNSIEYDIQRFIQHFINCALKEYVHTECHNE